VRSRLRHFGVFSLSAVDLFASAMGAFIIITIILMPDYQKEVRLEGHLKRVEELAAQTQAMADESLLGTTALERAVQDARTRQAQLQAEEEMLASVTQAMNARLTAQHQQPPPPPATPEEIDAELGSEQVTFRFLGLKSERTRYLLLIDMNSHLSEHTALVERSVRRALESLQPGMEFAIMGFQQLDSGPVYHHWPTNGALAPVDLTQLSRALRFTRELTPRFGGGSPMLAAFGEAFTVPADAVILISDGLPNPSFDDGLPPRALAQGITLANKGGREIHAVTVGDYFKYRGTVEFMESLAHANNGGFLALAQ
jgi:hypothetical protein